MLRSNRQNNICNNLAQTSWRSERITIDLGVFWQSQHRGIWEPLPFFFSRPICSPARLPIAALSFMICAVRPLSVRLSWRWGATQWPGIHLSRSSSQQPMRIRICTRLTFVVLTNQSTCTWIMFQLYWTWTIPPRVRNLWLEVLIKRSGFTVATVEEAGKSRSGQQSPVFKRGIMLYHLAIHYPLLM